MESVFDRAAGYLERLSQQYLDREGHALGIPKDQKVIRLLSNASRFNPKWTDYRLEFLGIHADPPRDDADYPYAQIEEIGIQWWRIRIWYRESRAFLEWKWRPRDWSDGVCLRSIDIDADAAEMNHLVLDGLQLLYQVRAGNSRSGTGAYPTREGLWSDIIAATQALKRENLVPRRDNIIARMPWNISRSRFYQLLEEHKLKSDYRQLMKDGWRLLD
jgi:hypothetical protein